MSEGSRRAVGEGLGLGLLIALAAAVPAATRVPGVGSFIVLWASAALLVGPVAAGVRLGRTHSNGGQTSATLGFGVILASPVLLVFASVLKTSTHHRPLGAITFALTACIVLLAAIAIAARWLDLARDAPSPRARTAARVTLMLAGGGSSIAVLVSAFRAVADGSVRALLLDAALLVSAVALAARLPVPVSLGRLLERAGAVSWLAVIASGFALGRSAEIAESIASRAPLLGWLAGF